MPDPSHLFKEFVDLAANPDNLENRIYQEIEMIDRLTYMINTLPEEEREDWIRHILGGMAAAFAVAREPTIIRPSVN